MPRFSPRATSDLKAFLSTLHGKRQLVRVENIGLGGAGLNLFNTRKLVNELDGAKLLLEVQFQDASDASYNCNVAHKNNHKIGVSFVGMDKGSQLWLWRHIASLFNKNKKCVYCGTVLDTFGLECNQCGWKLDFKSTHYFSYWEKEALLRSITNLLKELPVNTLYQISNDLIKKNEPTSLSFGVDPIEEFVGVSSVMKTVFSHIRKVAPTGLPVLILGESGTGKELTARSIYERSDRAEKPFVVINCSAIPESLIEAELFGHTKGAFTGAVKAKPGKFEEAHKGTLFLDEIGELPMNLQPKLLRFLEDQTIQRVGATRGKKVDVRIIAATNVDIKEAIHQGKFRDDLYYRIAGFTIHLPPLRERLACKEVLANYFLKKIKMERGWTCKGFTKEAIEAICNYAWPGNVREMINRIRRAVVVQDDWIRPEDMELAGNDHTGQESNLKLIDAEHKHQVLLTSLKNNRFNITRTSRSLGISRPYVYKLIKKFDIQMPTHPRR